MSTTTTDFLNENRLKAELTAETAGVVVRKLTALRDRSLDDAAAIVERAGAGPIVGQDWSEFQKRLDSVSKYDGALSTLSKTQSSAKRAAGFFVRSEPRTYEPGSGHSFYRDLAVSTTPGAAPNEFPPAQERLARHRKECEVESEGGGAEARYLERVTRETRRTTTAEQRAVDSTTSGALATPYYLVEQWAAYRSPARAFTDACRTLELPAYGLQVHVPSFTSPTTVTTQVENTGVSSSSPSGADLDVPVVMQAGNVVISQQFADRGGTPGLASDEIIHTQLMEQLDASIDSYVIAAATANAPTVTDSATMTAGATELFQDLAKARLKLTDTAGTRLQPSRVFMPNDLISWLSQQVDLSLRPIIQPDSSALVAVADDPTWASFAGFHLFGAIRVDADDNLPLVSGNLQMLVSRPQDAVLVLEGASAIPAAYPQPSATDLSVIISLRKYLAVVVRFSSGTCQISGSAYNGLN